MHTLHIINLTLTLVFSFCCAYQLLYLLLPLVKKVFDYATKEGVMFLLKSMGKRYLGKSAAKYVPLIGQGIAAAAGYGMMKYFGNAYIEDCYQLARKMRECDIKGDVIDGEVVEEEEEL